MEQRFQEALKAITDDEIIDIESRLVAIPSYTTEESEIAEFIADLLNDEGVEVGLQRVSFSDIPWARSKKSYNVIARFHGTGGGPSLMFNGHMDHGPIGGRDIDDMSGWSRSPFKPVIEDGFLYGKGSRDEKGGICAMLTTALALARSRLPLKGDLIVAPVCGHKTFSRGSRHLVNSGIRTDMAINTEDSGCGIVPLHVGVYKAEVKVRGAHPHPAIRRRFPGLKVQASPIQQALKLIEALGPEATPYAEGGWMRFKKHPVLVDFPWHHIEEIASNGGLGRTVHVWWRTPPGVTEETLRTDLERLLKRLNDADPSIRASTQIKPYGTALETPNDAPLVKALAKWHREIAKEEPNVGPDGRYGGYGDAAVLAEAGIQSVAYGPGGGLTDLENTERGMEGKVPPDERIPVRQIITAARVCTLATVDLLS